MIGLIDRMAVYSGDNFTVLVFSDEPCRLAHVQAAGATGDQRADLAALRNLIWGPTPIVNEYHQILIDGQRWNVIAGTFKALRGPAGTITYRQCDVVRAA